MLDVVTGKTQLVLGEVVRVEEMSADKAQTLLLNAVSEDLQSAGDELPSITTQLVNTLDRLALTVDLAGARIGSDVDEGAQAHDAMQRYLTDVQHHRDRLLQSREYTEATEYDQTVWTVWEASLVSLRDVEERDTSIRPIDFWALLTCLDRANIQTEMFRLASDSSSGERRRRGTRRHVGTGTRRSVRRPVTTRRDGKVWQDEGRWKESEQLFFAAWQGLAQELGKEHPSTLTAMAYLASTYRKQGRWKEAEELDVKVMEGMSRMLGEEHPDMLSAMADLAATYRNQGRWKEAEELEGRHLLFNRLRGEDEKFNPSILRLSLLLLLFDVYLTWARIEKATPTPLAPPPGLLQNATLSTLISPPQQPSPHQPQTFLATQPILFQYAFFLLLCAVETASFHLPIRFLLSLPHPQTSTTSWPARLYNFLLPHYPHPSLISTALLVSSFTKLFPLLLLVWNYDLPSSASAVSWAVIINNVAALEIVLGSGYLRAMGLCAVGAICRAGVGWGILRMVGVGGGIAAAGVVETADVIEMWRRIAEGVGFS
ncbi:hypothetical protein B0A48_09236 [Cryoendolithus antarcticus]|uniref:Protein ARV n=1 Tax=Cryoendolithus antarcticus TaxID=1507870 RepID=A0A1V8T240_9PEZI|nr:hypothetical protein B0A48_09236 [Cryoendolithus antarcticus]